MKQNVNLNGLLFAFLILVAGCDLFDANSEKKEEPQGAQKQELLVALIGNNPAGFWFFETDSLALVDSLYLDYTPSDFTIDTVENRLIWIENVNSTEKVLHSYRYADKTELTTTTANTKLQLISNSSLLLVHGRAKTQLYNVDDLSLIREDSIGVIVKAFPSHDDNTFYALVWDTDDQNRLLNFITVNTNNLEITHSILVDSVSQVFFYDATFLEDKHSLYLALNVSTMETFELYGQFIEYDVKHDKVVKVFDCGPHPSLAASPDGEHIYIGWEPGIFEIPIKDKNTYQFSTKSKSISVLWGNNGDLGLTTKYNSLFSINLVVSPNNRFIFIPNAAIEAQTNQRLDILKVDVEEQNVATSFAIRKNTDGKVSTIIRKMGFIYREIETKNSY